MTSPQNNNENIDEIQNTEIPGATEITDEAVKPSENTEQCDMPAEKPKKSKKKIIKRIIVITLCVILVLILALVGTVWGMWYAGKKSFRNKNVKLAPAVGVEAIINDDNSVIYDGKAYRYNENVATCLFIGVDNDKTYSKGELITGNAGQGDAIYLIAIDTVTGKTTVIGVPRDTITDVDIYSKSGSFAGVKPIQICLAYAYGDGKTTSCENTAKAVSRLFYGIPINMYFSVDEKSMAALHNAVGPITVIPNETLKHHSVEITKGVKLKLTGSNVFQYLQARDDKKTNASYLRMERQLDYIKKYSISVYEKTKNDLLFPVELYKKIKNNAVTDVSVSKITYLASVIIKNKSSAEFEYISLEGEMKKGADNYAEFYPDEDKLFETVLKVYYNEIK